MNETVIHFAKSIESKKPINEEVKVGKDILDLITTSMYVDPLNVYREYIQNAVDSIEVALEQSLSFEDEPKVNISFDLPTRSVKIMDNGVSLSNNDFLTRIISIGGSQKRGTKLRGFRGIGRLSGLGYCQELIFRGRTSKDEDIVEVTWDGRKLKERYRDPNYSETLGHLVKDVTSQRTFQDDSYPGRFFEVEMKKIARLRNDVLLNEKLIADYLGQTGPVDFHDDFKFKTEINDFLAKHNCKKIINIFINESEQVFKPHRNEIVFTNFVQDQIKKPLFKEFTNTDGDLLAIGWFLDHNYFGSIPKNLGISGIRLRTGNIQVGDDATSSHLFQESRFSGWVIGEIHILSPKIIPNGRRDEFEVGAKYQDLQNLITIHTKDFAKIIREKSSIRNQKKFYGIKFNLLSDLLDHLDNDLDPIIANGLYELIQESINETNHMIDKSMNGEELKLSLMESNKKIEARLKAESKGKIRNTKQSALIKRVLKNCKDFKEGIQLSNDLIKLLK